MIQANGKRTPDWAWLHRSCAAEPQGEPPARGHACLNPSGCSARAECERHG